MGLHGRQMSRERLLYRGVWVRLGWTFFSLVSVVFALFVSWHVLAAMDFLYPWGYEVLDIDRTIAIYGPKNRYRRDFETTTKDERVRLFGEIVDAIHDRGRGLPSLVYRRPDGRPIDSLLTPPEVVHLRDVAHLVGLMQWIGWGAALSWVSATLALSLRGVLVPPLKTLFTGMAAAMAVIVMLIVLIGPVRVFYALHTWVFPKDHPWFFYYADSLMSMMMKAPDLFGYITVCWVGLAILIMTGLLWTARQATRWGISYRGETR